MLRVARVQSAFDFTEVLHSLGKGVADPDDMIAWLQFERGSFGGAFREESKENSGKGESRKHRTVRMIVRGSLVIFQPLPLCHLQQSKF